MLTPLLQLAAAAACATLSCDAAPIDPRLLAPVPIDTAPRRPRAIEYSDWYGRRLTIHRWASYAMLPAFAGEYVYGQRLLHQREDAFHGVGDGISDGDRQLHQVLAGTVAALFGLNTVTGAWNLYEARRDPAGRTTRLVHSALLLAADAGFVATGVLAGRASEGSPADARTHRTVALASMGVATVGTGMMWVLHVVGR